jgi:threonyl-tRNA synthetase
MEYDNLFKKRHSLAHLLAMSVLEYDPDAKLAIGPVIDNGFYYDIDFSEGNTPTGENLKTLEQEMKNIISKELDFTLKELTLDEAAEIFKAQPYKLEMIEEIIKKGEKITVYKTGEFIDLCRGPHIENTKEIDPESFSITHMAGAYWRGDEKNKMLTRIYGLAFNNKEELDSYITQQEEAKKRDHRKLGEELDLFVFSEVVGKGLPLWTKKGATIRRELERYIVDEEIKRDYQHVYTPDIAKLDLYKKSGHYPYYKESMYSPITIDEDEFMLRPMTCPHHYELYLSRPRSYRELPMRIAELAKLYRYEQSGELSGLVRVRSFCLADAHIICRDPDQAADEVSKALDLIEDMAKTFGLIHGVNYSYRLSLGDRNDESKYFKDDTAWDDAENKLRDVLKARNAQFIESPNEAAFYGPKIDIQMKDVRGKENTAFTVQYDFVMPKRFELMYTDSDGQQKEAIVIHRSSIGAIERIVAFLIEHFAGAFPIWLSPVQIKIVPISDKHLIFAEQVFNDIKKEKIRVELDSSSENLGKKIRSAKIEKVPYIIVIGDKEIESNKVTLESRDKGSLGQKSIGEVIEKLTEEIQHKVL